jgi:hypothetical protein
MGKSTERDIAIEQEFSKLEMLLMHTSSDAVKCLKILKKNLGDFDKRHGRRHFRSTSKYLMQHDVRVAKDLAKDLGFVAKRIRKSKSPSTSEVDAARSSMNATADALNDLKTAARTYDQNYGKSGGVTGILDNVLGSDNDDHKESSKGGFFGSGKKKGKSQGGLFGRKSSPATDNNGVRGGILGSSDTVETVVKATLRDSFSGFSALKNQISATESALSPSVAVRAKEAVVEVANKLTGDSQARKHNKSVSL